jgi:PAS domain-containing protein
VRTTWALWIACLVLTPVILVLEDLAVRSAGTPGHLRVSTAVAFLWGTLALLWPARALRTQMVWLTAATVFLAHLLTLGAVQGAWWTSARGAVAVVVQVAATITFYRWRVGDDNLVPHRPRDVAGLALASVLGALLVAPLGPVPGLTLTSPPLTVAWWVALGASHVFIAGACVMLLIQRAPRSEALPTRLSVLYAQLLITTLSIAVVFALSELPITWILLLPAVWAGMTLGPWAAAVYSLTGSLAVILVRVVPLPDRPYGPLDRAEALLLDSLMASFVFIVLLLALLRDQRAHLAEEVVRRRQEALDQAGLLGTVFESINEGLILSDTIGDVRLHNAAAERILGSKLLAEPAQWLRRDTGEPSFTYTSTGTAARTDYASWRSSSHRCSTPVRTASWRSCVTSPPSSGAWRTWPALPPSPPTT